MQEDSKQDKSRPDLQECMKTAWHFKVLSGKGGTFINPYPIGAEEALMECRLSLGDQVTMVY